MEQEQEVKIEEETEKLRTEEELRVRRGLSIESWRDSREDERIAV